MEYDLNGMRIDGKVAGCRWVNEDGYIDAFERVNFHFILNVFPKTFGERYREIFLDKNF
jgi:hypothetical protein